MVLQGELKSCLTSRSKLLLHKEETLRQQSKATWLLARDENTRYFHQFANKRRVNNSIWEAVEVDNTTVFYQVSIKKVARNFFADLYKESDSYSIEDQLNIINLFPSYVAAEDNRLIFRPVTLSEVESTLKIFAKDKTPGLDGCTVEFFLHFFDILGMEMVVAIEDS